MSSEERKKILQMVESGKLSADEAARLMRALDESAEDEIEVIEAASGPRSEPAVSPEFEDVRKRAMSFAMIPLWTGIVLSVLGALGMYAAQASSGYGFWFFCSSVPLLLGILLIAAGSGGANSHWIYVNVDRTRARDWPRNITLALPLPLGLVSWFLRAFGAYIEGLNKTQVDEVLVALAQSASVREPLIVNVDEGEDGERVQVFIG